jgi:uncharacterized protein YecA (UPF0149 family)
MSSSKANRNDPCPCGSGKKFKKCCALKTGMQKYQTSVIKAGNSSLVGRISQFGSAMKDKQEELETKKIQAEIKKDNQEKTS